MADLQLEIEGEGAISASEELLKFEGFSGSYTVESDEDQKEIAIATVVAIVSLTAGTMTIANHIYNWYQNSRKKPTSLIDKAILICGSKKILLENATIEQIQKFLESC
jgi:hypothetical protein